MGKPQRFAVDSLFEDVDEQKQVHDLQDQIFDLETQMQLEVSKNQELESTIANLRSKPIDEQEKFQLESTISELRDQLQRNQGSIQYLVDKMHANPKQPRQSFNAPVQTMVNSLQTEGQLDPVILLANGMIFDGECRWRAAQVLGWKTLEAVFINETEDEKNLRRKAFITTIHRNDLNELDKAEVLMIMLCDEIEELEPERIPTLIGSAITRLKRKGSVQKLGEDLRRRPITEQVAVLKSLELSEIEFLVFKFILGLQLSPISVSKNILPTLKLSQDLRTAIRDRDLGCYQAIELNKLSAKKLDITEKQAKKLRAEAIDYVLNEGLSVQNTRTWVANQLKARQPETPDTKRDKQIDQLIHSIKNFSLEDTEPTSEQLAELQQILKQALEAIGKR